MAAFAQNLARFLDLSPTPFHAVENMVAALAGAGFEELREDDSWNLRPAGRYYCVRNGSSLIAFTWQQQPPKRLALAGAHTDSPCLRLLPDPLVVSEGYLCLGVQVYGGALLYPWFDRNLGLAGRVAMRAKDGTAYTQLVRSAESVAIIPSLAIHLDRNANAGHPIQVNKEMRAVLGRAPAKLPEFSDWLRGMFPDMGADEVLGCELSLYDSQPASVFGDDWIASARLDNLLSCQAACAAMCAADVSGFNMLVCHDHEEVGSLSWSGARGDMVRRALERLVPDGEQRAQMCANSLMLSVDGAHGVHPNYGDKHALRHKPLLGQGPVLKLDESQRYAGDALHSAEVKLMAERAGVPLQVFAVRPDMACGSTIGPISTASLGIATVDIGAPQWAMHSVRESACCADAEALMNLLQTFWGVNE